MNVGPFHFYSFDDDGWSFWIGDHFQVSYMKLMKPRLFIGFV